jgi:putative endonuclease
MPAIAHRKEEVYFAYILSCNDGTLYVGSTNNLEKRLYSHNNLKSGAHYTKIRRPVKLVYSEQFLAFGEAKSREAQLKKYSRQEKLDLVKQGTIA